MPQLYTTEVATPAEYAKLRADNPDAIIPAPGEPWVMDKNNGLKTYARDGQGNTGWYYTATDLFVPD